MQPPTCCGRAALLHVVSVLRRSGGAFGGAQHRLVLGQARTALRRRSRPARDRRFVRRRLAVRRRSRSAPSRRRTAGRSCRPPVRRASALLTSGSATSISSRARALDFRLGDAELVDALAHDVDRAVRAIRRRPSTAPSAWPGRRARRRPSGRARGASFCVAITADRRGDQSPATSSRMQRLRRRSVIVRSRQTTCRA